jgi:glyoxylase-like metal-dependent hydrolase (beta-lactamase superfamily II)
MARGALVSECIDLMHIGHAKVISTWLVRDAEGRPALVDCGPATCIAYLKAGLAARGLELHDVRHLLLTHIHLDHAGAAGTLVREHPELRVHVSEIGAQHIVDPSRLERSARRLYGDTFDALWGELAPVPEENVEVAREHAAGLAVVPAPGHASHQVAYFDDAGAVYPGDALGVRIVPATYIAPVAPPPDVDLEGWEETFTRIEERRPSRLCLPHFGAVEDVDDHIARMRRNLHVWAERVHGGMSQEEFEVAGEHELEDGSDPGTAESYRRAAPFWHSWQGLRRYWDKRAEEPKAM